MDNQYKTQNIARGQQAQPTMDELRDEAIGAQTNIIPADHNRIGPFRKSKLGLIQETDCTEEQWWEVGKQLFLFEDYLQLFIGDWLVAGEREWGKTYEAIADHFHKSKKTLRNYRWVCGSVKLSLRRDNLTYSHYHVVAGLAYDEQARLLTWASENNASVAKLRSQIPGNNTGGGDRLEKQVTSYTSKIMRGKAEVPYMKPEKRQEFIEQAKFLGEYYMRLAHWAMGEEE